MNLTPKQRESIRLKYAGCCAYCGCQLPAKWHVDHIAPVGRQGKWVRGTFVLTGALDHPDRDHIANTNPACVPCNIDKGPFTLEQWRTHLRKSAEVLRTNYSRYRHAVRFRLITERPASVLFHFERRRL